jgi:McrBC 5-methylcytosine restriction system component
MKACTVTEFDNVELPPDRDPPRARGLSLRDLSRGGDDPQANIMPFERDESGAWRASRWIGTFHHEGVDYTIIPRIGVKLFARIAVEAVSVALLPEGAGPNRSKLHGLLDLLPLVWCLALRRARSRQGIPRLYVERRAVDRVSLRGRLDLPRQLTENRFAQQHLACIWSELTFDNPITRMILITIDHLARARSFPFGGQGGNFARELEELRTQLLLHGTRRYADLPEERISWSRANDRYRIVHDFGRAIVRRRRSDSAPTAGDAVLLDSAEIWELFLFRRLQAVIRKNRLKLRIEWPRERRTAPRMLLEWQGRRTRALIPDIVVTESDGGGRTAILDAKYRAFAAPDADHSVADQMALYAMTADASAQPPGAAGAITQPTMLLVYPKANASGVKGLNSGMPDGKIGEGRFLFHDGRESRLIAWCVPVPETDDEVKFDESVADNLCDLLTVAFPPL